MASMPRRGRDSICMPKESSSRSSCNNNAVQFYGTALDTPSTSTRVYWLARGRAEQEPHSNLNCTGGTADTE